MVVDYFNLCFLNTNSNKYPTNLYYGYNVQAALFANLGTLHIVKQVEQNTIHESTLHRLFY